MRIYRYREGLALLAVSKGGTPPSVSRTPRVSNTIKSVRRLGTFSKDAHFLVRCHDIRNKHRSKGNLCLQILGDHGLRLGDTYV